MTRYDYSKGLDKTDIENKFYESVKVVKFNQYQGEPGYKKMMADLGVYIAQ